MKIAVAAYSTKRIPYAVVFAAVLMMNEVVEYKGVTRRMGGISLRSMMNKSILISQQPVTRNKTSVYK